MRSLWKIRFSHHYEKGMVKGEHTAVWICIPTSLFFVCISFSFSKYQRTITQKQNKIQQDQPPTRPHQGREGQGHTSATFSTVCLCFPTMTHPDIPILMIRFPVPPSVTVEHAVLGHPVWAAVSSLGCNGTDLLPIAKVNLKPLIMVTVRWRPSPSTWTK